MFDSRTIDKMKKHLSDRARDRSRSLEYRLVSEIKPRIFRDFASRSLDPDRRKCLESDNDRVRGTMKTLVVCNLVRCRSRELWQSISKF